MQRMEMFKNAKALVIIKIIDYCIFFIANMLLEFNVIDLSRKFTTIIWTSGPISFKEILNSCLVHFHGTDIHNWTILWPCHSKK